MPRRTYTPDRPRQRETRARCSICGDGFPAWRRLEPDVICWRHDEASTAQLVGGVTLKRGTTPLRRRGRSATSADWSNGVRLDVNRTA